MSSYAYENNVRGARTETIVDPETGATQHVSRGIGLGMEPEEQFQAKGEDVIKISTLKEIVAEADDYSAFVAAIEAL